MTDAALNTHSVPVARPGPLVITLAVTYAVLMVVSGPQVLDPMVRHDDFPALLADPSGFYIKTLHEGRWLNYVWHLRDWVAPAWVNFALYQFFWATFAAAAAVNACGRTAPLGYTIALALLIGVAPPALLISLWFNTLIPGIAAVALFAVLSTALSPRVMRWLLLVFVPVTLMAYTTYPLLLFAVCLTSHALRHTWRELFWTSAVFVASFALGILVIYTLNYWEHGVFGIPMAEWRNPTPAVDWASALANVREFGVFLETSALTLSFHFVPLMIAHGVLAVAALVILGRRTPLMPLYLLAVVAAGLALIALQIVLSGVTVAVRATGFIWMVYVVAIVRAAIILAEQGPLTARIARNVVFFILASYVLQMGKQYFNYLEWQQSTRGLAQEIGAGSAPVFVSGDFMALPGAASAGIQQPRGLRLRLTYLTGRAVVLCNEEPAACAGRPVFPGSTEPAVRHGPDAVYVTLPTRAAS